jgi:hypothetical protein
MQVSKPNALPRHIRALSGLVIVPTCRAGRDFESFVGFFVDRFSSAPQDRQVDGVLFARSTDVPWLHRQLLHPARLR